MSNIKNIIEKSVTLPLFIQNIDVKKKQEANMKKKANSYFSYKVLVALSCFFLLSEAYGFSDKFLTYCNHTNHAELKIVEGRLQEALLNYDSAFVLYPQPLAKDIHNAIVCAKKIKNERKLQEYLDLMIETKSLDPVYYKKIKVFKHLTDEKKMRINIKYTDKIKDKDYLFVQKLVKKDQSVRSGKFIPGIDRITLEEYQKHFGNSPPNEDLMIDFPCSARADEILYTHWLQSGFDVEAMMESLLENLQYVNAHYAIQKEMLSFFKSKYGILVILREKGKSTKVNRTQEELIEIDKNRTLIGLDNYEEYMMKIPFFKKNKEYCYNTAYFII